nr:metallophosphoesterase 1-like [Lepeophtheirus salmonis]
MRIGSEVISLVFTRSGIENGHESDRYLSISFQWLLWAYKPSIIIFLGDLIDEASTTDDEDVYKSYVDRFYSIYSKDSAPRTIYIPGDNDIGGEGLDMVTEKKLKRFNTYFNGCGAFFRVSKRTQVLTYDPLKDTFPFINKKDSKVKIFASHRPITTLIEPEDYRFKFAGRPSVIFSAHHHYGSVYKLFLQYKLTSLIFTKIALESASGFF